MSEILRAHKLIWELLLFSVAIFLQTSPALIQVHKLVSIGLISDSDVSCLFPAGYVTLSTVVRC